MFKKIISFLLVSSSMSFAMADSQICDSSMDNNTPNSDFISHKNGTTTHKKTGLMWTTCSIGQDFKNNACHGSPKKFNWHAAMQLASESRFAKYDDWRLPTIDELNSIVETRCHNPSINQDVFPNTPSTGFWSSSLVARLKNNARAMFFFYGEDSNFYQKNLYTVRLVRKP